MEMIDSISKFEKCVQTYQEQKKYIFRGQANVDWNVVSSAYRFIKEAYPSLKITDEILTAFEQRIPEYVQNDYPNGFNNNEENSNSSKLLCILQHMGGKTTYVDFSKDFKIAVYFACEQCEDKDGMIFICKKVGEGKVENLQGKQLGESIEINENEIGKLGYKAATNRMKEQQSCFLKILNNSDDEEKDGLLSCGDFGNEGCIRIAKEVKMEILQKLKDESKICRQTIYPDLYDFISHQSLYNEYA